MPMPVGALNVLRSHPQASDLYLVIQQPEQRTPGLYSAWADYDWSCQIDGAPTGDPVTALTINNGDAGPVNLLDGMTVFIGSELGDWDKAIVRLRGDQTVTGATTTLDIAVSSDIAGIVEDDDYVVVLDEFRLWQRFGFIDIVAGDVVWCKDWDITWAAVGSTLAAMPPVPIMGPHAVKFVEPGETVRFYFDWADSYATAPGQATTAWVSWGETDHIGGTWNSGIETPGWENYVAISGLAGFRVVLEVDDGNGNAATLPFRRGVRYVFTLRRPGESQPGDPWNAEPLTSFQIDNITGSFQTGYWRTRITVYEDEASRYIILPGALVIVFSEDRYAEHDPYLGPLAESIGPIYDRENILFVGRIAAGSVEYDSETQTATFDVVSLGEEMSSYENYPIVINDDALSTDWIGTPTLTVDRAVRYYVAWHTTLSLIADVFQTGDAHGIKAQDFMEGDIYSTLNSFLRDRLFARLLADRFGRCFCSIDLQMQAVGSGVTLWSLDAGDWLDKLAIQHYDTDRCNAAEAGGLRYLGGDITPYLSRAPGIYSKYRGRPKSSNALAITDQDELNTLSGRLLAYANLEYQVRLDLMGNWRIGDIVPQEYVVVDLDHVRGDIDNKRFIIREKSYSYNAVAGVISASMLLEQESDGPAGQTVEIPAELPEVPVPPPGLPVNPGGPPDGWGGEDRGRRIICTPEGVFVTDNIGAVDPYWYAVNDGFVTADDLYVYDIKRDPFHWWTSGGTERTLWAMTRSGLWVHGPTVAVPVANSFPDGVWRQVFTKATIIVAIGRVADANPLVYGRISLSIETAERLCFTCCYYDCGDGNFDHTGACVVQNEAIVNATELIRVVGANQAGRMDVKFAQHSAGLEIWALTNEYPCHAAENRLRIWRTVNGGGVWAQVGSVSPIGAAWRSQYVSISIPYVDAANPDLYILLGWGGGCAGSVGGYKISEDAGVSFNNLSGSFNQYSKIGTGGNPDRIWMLNRIPSIAACQWSNDRAATWTPLPLVPVAMSGIASFVEWVGDELQAVLIGGEIAGVGTVYYWTSWGGWQDKTGNLAAYTVTNIFDIQRDTMGAA